MQEKGISDVVNVPWFSAVKLDGMAADGLMTELSKFVDGSIIMDENDGVDRVRLCTVHNIQTLNIGECMLLYFSD